MRKIYARGIDVLAGFIVGFDRDTEATFEAQHDFILKSGIQAAMIGLLTALPRTPLYERLEREGRLRRDVAPGDNTKLGTNVVPRNMPYEAMIEGYRRLVTRLVSDTGIAGRIRNKMRQMSNPIYGGEYSASKLAGILTRLLVNGILRGGVSRVFHFLRSIPWLAPKKYPLVVTDWIAGLAMRDYVDRHFGWRDGRQVAVVAGLRRSIRKAVAAYIEAGSVALALTRPAVGAPALSIRIRGWVDRDFFRRVGRPLERLLRNSPSTLNLHIEDMRESVLPDLQRLLRRLRQHGDRVFIFIGEKWRGAARIDSSVFNIVFEPAALPRLTGVPAAS